MSTYVMRLYNFSPVACRPSPENAFIHPGPSLMDGPRNPTRDPPRRSPRSPPECPPGHQPSSKQEPPDPDPRTHQTPPWGIAWVGSCKLPQGPLGNKIAVVSPCVMRLCDFSNILGEGGVEAADRAKAAGRAGWGGLTLTNPLGVSC